MKNSGLAIASMVVGISSLVFSWVPFVPFFLTLLAVIFGAIALRKIKQNPDQLGGKGMAITGLVLGIIGLIPAILILAICGSVCATAGAGGLGSF